MSIPVPTRSYSRFEQDFWGDPFKRALFGACNHRQGLFFELIGVVKREFDSANSTAAARKCWCNIHSDQFRGQFHGAIRRMDTSPRIATGGWLIEGTQGPPNLPASGGRKTKCIDVIGVLVFLLPFFPFLALSETQTLLRGTCSLSLPLVSFFVLVFGPATTAERRPRMFHNRSGSPMAEATSLSLVQRRFESDPEHHFSNHRP